MAYTASGTVRDLHTRAVVGGVTVYAFRKDTGAAHSTASATSNATTGVFSFTDLTDGVDYDFIADVKAGPHVVIQAETRRSVWLTMGAVTHASVASNGANARLGQFTVLDPNGIRIRSAVWMPTGADQATHGTASTSASYRRLEIYNGATSGTVTATASRIGSLNLTASLASLGTRGFTIDTTVTVASGQVVYFSQSTVGGTDNDGTILAAGALNLSYEML